MATAETGVREHGVMFKGPLVRAILEGRKVQTRRVITARNSTVLGYAGSRLWHHLHFDHDKDGIRTYVDGSLRSEGWEYLHVPAWHPDEPDEVLVYRVRPTVFPGDRFWVREAFAPRYFDDGKPAYRADYTAEIRDIVPEPKWTPAIHMPRELCRLVLEVTAVRAERLQDISEADAIAEGSRIPIGWFKPSLQACLSERAAFRQIWDRLAPAGSRWSDNPWVWAYAFKVLSPTP